MKMSLYLIKFIVDDDSGSYGELQLMEYSSGVARFAAKNILRENCKIISVYPVSVDDCDE